MFNNCLGWDIGGAHVKAALVNQAGTVIGAYQQPCPLWKGLDQLQEAVNAILQVLPQPSQSHAITMTGELVDCFADRNDGVAQIISAMQNLLPDASLMIFAGQLGLLPVAEVNTQHYEAIASTNWLASAAYAAKQVGEGLFIDIGSTTTDILALKQNQVIARGMTDFQRLMSQELVYTGIVRTAVMAVAQSVNFEGQDCGLMAEYFATMADVYRLTNELNEHHDQTDTADGAEKTVFASAKRLARMVGCDFVPSELYRWQAFANAVRAQQLQKIKQACLAQLDHSQLSSSIPWVGAGIGRFLVKQLASDLGYAYLDFSDLCPQLLQPSKMTAADCAPAVAVAQLALAR
jgi:probable H4MPT-linked C1 transfer pathway protein